MRARLIDLEGLTVAEIGLHPVHDGHPPLVIEMAANPKLITGEPASVMVKALEYELERVDGGGTLIYRRRTGPWG